MWTWSWVEGWKVIESFLEEVILGQFSGTLNNFLSEDNLNHLKMSCNFIWSNLQNVRMVLRSPRSDLKSSLNSWLSYNSIFCLTGPQIKRWRSQKQNLKTGQIRFLNTSIPLPQFLCLQLLSPELLASRSSACPEAFSASPKLDLSQNFLFF